MTSEKSTRDRILDAARDLIARRGYSNFSYADISTAITLHKASIHHHFPTKSALAVAVAHHSRAIFEADMAAAAQAHPDPVGQLRVYFDYWEHNLLHDHEAYCVAGMLGAEVPFLDVEVAQAVAEYFASIMAWLENLLATGAASGRFHLSEAAPDEAATLVSLIYGAVLVARATRNPPHFKQATNAAMARLTGAAA